MIIFLMRRNVLQGLRVCPTIEPFHKTLIFLAVTGCCARLASKSCALLTTSPSSALSPELSTKCYAENYGYEVGRNNCCKQHMEILTFPREIENLMTLHAAASQQYLSGAGEDLF